MRALGLGLGLLLLSVSAALAQGDERPPRRVGLHRIDGRLAVSVVLSDLFWPSDGERLRSGFASRIVIRSELYRDGQPQPVAREEQHSDIVYDIWDEKFRVRVFGRAGTTERQVSSAREAIELATALRRFPVAALERVTPGATYRIRLRADLNPLPQELVSDVRRWLVRPPAHGRGGTSESFFGSFVSIFVNPKIEESERRISFWSQPFVEPPG
jgi:hypothetical protein